LRNRIEDVHKKGFNIMSNQEDTNQLQSTGYQGLPNNTPALDFSKIKVGAKTLDDAILKFGNYKKVNPRLADKATVLRAIDTYDLPLMREISDFFYKCSGIYARILRYMAFMYRYDWMVTPYVNDDKIKQEKLLTGFYNSLQTLEHFGVKKTLGEIAQDILINGAYYGYKVKTKDGIVLQQLPADYCRSRFNQGNKPAIEFNMKYFDDCFRDTTQRMKVLKLFPNEFSKGYILYKQGKLPPEFMGDTSGWYLLDTEMTVKFTANGEDYPAFISVIPLIIDLDEAQALDRKKTLQKLLKIVVQKMPLDKNGELIFDVEEAQQLHNNAVQMLSRAINIDVLTTFADVEVEDMDSSNSTNSQSDDLARVERQLFNEAGVSQMQFNTDGNIALEKSILNDEATMYNMLLQFEGFLNELIEPFNTNKKKVEYRVQLLTTTIYNYKELAKLYKEQVTLGYSKMLPQIALGQTQSSVLANAYFENDVLSLSELFIPPMQSSTMNADVLRQKQASAGQTNKDGAGAGRPEKPDDEKSTKTIQNKESQN
jgi:hypothetical protein